MTRGQASHLPLFFLPAPACRPPPGRTTTGCPNGAAGFSQAVDIAPLTAYWFIVTPANTATIAPRMKFAAYITFPEERK